jgi:hypothetical protein
MKKTIYFAIASLALGTMSASAAVDCVKLSVSVKHAVAAERASVLEIVAAQINANPGCACEIVKAAIEGANADAVTVAAIVEAASVAAPDQMRLVAQCAVAVAPDALGKVQAMLAKLDPNKGEGKSAKGAAEPAAEAAPSDNPLDFPGSSRENNVGPRTGDNPNGTGPGNRDPGSDRGVNGTDPGSIPDDTTPVQIIIF